MKTIIYTAILLSMAITGANAQQVTAHAPWTKEDSAAINALALYPDSVRLQIFQACEYPAIVVNVATLQKNSSAAFVNLLSSYPKAEQEDIYNMTRYPNLISKIVNGGKKSKEDMDAILAGYPNEIHDVAFKYGQNNYDLLKSINDLQNETNQQFSLIISSYPPDVQKTFTNLLQLPEVLSLLNDHLSLTVRVGDHFKRDPQWVMRKSDSTALAEARRNAEELKEWKQTIQQDTSAQRELKEAANTYADSNGYKKKDVDAPLDSNVVNNYSVYPYSYWFGYPAWYPYAYWYPYPYWYDWGFYYGPYGDMVIFGFPSFYFLNWYFYYPFYWHRYPHLGSAYIHHYYGPRGLNTMSRLVVHGWVQDNRRYLPAGFISNDAKRSETIRQLGQLNEAAMNKEGTVDAQARDQYLAKNSSKFSALNGNPNEPKVGEERINSDARPGYTRQPAVNTQRLQPNNTPRTQYNYNNIQRAQQYHSGTWQQAQPAYHPQQNYSPARSGGSYGGGRSGGGGGGRR